MDNPQNKPASVILVYDKPDSNKYIGMSLQKAGFNVHSFFYGEDFIKAWKKNLNDIVQSDAIIVHKDLSDYTRFREYRRYMNPAETDSVEYLEKLKSYITELAQKDTMTCTELLKELREFEDGQSPRVILGSGEYSYEGVRNESINILKADAGYDPSEKLLPQWVIDCINLGKVSSVEAQTYRGKEIIENPFQVQLRAEFIQKINRGEGQIGRGKIEIE